MSRRVGVKFPFLLKLKIFVDWPSFSEFPVQGCSTENCFGFNTGGF